MADTEKVAYLSDLDGTGPVPPGAVTGDIAVFGESGNLQDSGKKLSDIAEDTADAVSEAFGEAARSASDEDAVAAYRAPAWEASTTYAAGDYCMLSGLGYRCVSAHTSGQSFEPSKWTLVLSAAGKSAIDALLSGYSDGTKADDSDIAPSYSFSSSYAVDALVFKDGVLNICTNAGTGPSAVFSSTTVGIAIQTTVGRHANDTSIHVTAQEKSGWDAKQDEITDLEDIRANAEAGYEASMRDEVRVDMSGQKPSVDAVSSATIESVSATVSHVTNSNSETSNCFRMRPADYTDSFSALDGRASRLVKFTSVGIFLGGSEASAKLAIFRTGGSTPLAESAEVTLLTATGGALNTFTFTNPPWLDALESHDFRILTPAGEYVSGVVMYFDATHAVYGFEDGQNGESYRGVTGCFRGGSSFICLTGAKVLLATKADIPTDNSQLENGAGYLTEDDIPSGVTVDNTLTVSGKAADAAATGTAISDVSAVANACLPFGFASPVKTEGNSAYAYTLSDRAVNTISDAVPQGYGIELSLPAPASVSNVDRAREFIVVLSVQTSSGVPSGTVIDVSFGTGNFIDYLGEPVEFKAVAGLTRVYHFMEISRTGTRFVVTGAMESGLESSLEDLESL